jgi:HEAT repeat protein
MADPKQLDEIYDNEPAPIVPRRSSDRIDLKRFEAIARRQELNAALLRRTCGVHDAAPQEIELRDLNLLRLMAGERDPNANPTIRKHAIHALGQFKDLQAIELLWEIASSDLEAEAVRGHALLALARVSRKMAPGLLRWHLEDESPLIRQATVNALVETADEAVIGLLADLLERDSDAGVRQRAAAAIQSLAKQLNARAPRVRAPRRPRRPRAPARET